MMIRQGDVLLIPAPLPKQAVVVAGERQRGGLVLAHGEATGHAHVLTDAEELRVAERRFVRLTVVGKLFHDEHAPIAVPPGTYEVRRQREYTPEEIRTVTD